MCLPLPFISPPFNQPFTLQSKISLNLAFCVGLSVMGNRTLYFTTKLPLCPGFLEMGMPRPGYESEEPGWVGPALSMLRFLPSMVVMVRFQPVRASFRVRSTVWIMSSPSRVKRGWGFCENKTG
jgi:hypothetical protein